VKVGTVGREYPPGSRVVKDTAARTPLRVSYVVRILGGLCHVLHQTEEAAVLWHKSWSSTPTEVRANQGLAEQLFGGPRSIS